MPQSKREGIFLSLIMSLIMIYVMAALNECVKSGVFTGEAWSIALPIQMLIVAPLSARAARKISSVFSSDCSGSDDNAIEMS